MVGVQHCQALKKLHQPYTLTRRLHVLTIGLRTHSPVLLLEASYEICRNSLQIITLNEFHHTVYQAPLLQHLIRLSFVQIMCLWASNNPQNKVYCNKPRVELLAFHRVPPRVADRGMPARYGGYRGKKIPGADQNQYRCLAADRGICKGQRKKTSKTNHLVLQVGVLCEGPATHPWKTFQAKILNEGIGQDGLLDVDQSEYKGI